MVQCSGNHWGSELSIKHSASYYLLRDNDLTSWFGTDIKHVILRVKNNTETIFQALEAKMANASLNYIKYISC